MGALKIKLPLIIIKFLPLPLVARKCLNCALQIIVILLETHRFRHHRSTCATNFFYTTWKREQLTKTTISAKINGGLGYRSIQKV